MTLAERVKAHSREYQEAKRGKEFRKQLPGYWRASSMGKCARLQAYDFLGFEKKEIEPIHKAWSLEDGHLHEGDVIERICSLPQVKKIADNKVIKRTFKTASGKELKIAGTPDLLVSDGGMQELIEVKALQDAAFQEVVRKDEPPRPYVVQALVYCILLNMKKATLFFKSRNRSDPISFEVELTKDEKKSILKRQLWIQKYIDHKKLPPREFQLGSQECFYCPHSKRCHQGKQFKGYIHKKEGQKNIDVDLSEEPKAQSVFMVAAKTYEKAKRQIEELSVVQDEAKEKLERLLKKYKADGLYAQGYSAKRVFSETSRPDSTAIKALVKKGMIPMIKGATDYIRVDLPRGKK